MKKLLHLLSVLFFCLGLGALAPAAQAQELLSSGHVDAFYVTAPGGQLTLGLKEDITGDSVQRPGDDVILGVDQSAYSDETTSISGIGAPSYYLPQSQVQGLLWPGWDTQPAREGGFTDVDLVFQQVSGPGSVYIFEASSFGAISGVTTDGSLQLSSGSVINQAYPAHRHVNWAFTEAGRYTMRVVAQSNGVESNAVTYTWNVGDGSAASASSHSAGAAGSRGAAADRAAAPGQHSAAAGHAAPAQQRAAAGHAPRDAAGHSGEKATSSAAVGTCGLVAQLRDDSVTPGRWVDADGATFFLGDNSSVDLPQQVGTVPAGKAWMIGSTQVPGVPWLGASTQHPEGPGPVVLKLTGFRGPGPVAVYTQGGLGKVVGDEWFSATPEHAITEAVFLDKHTHVHPNWVFGAPGSYEVTVTQTAVETGATGTATLHFQVGGAADAAPAGSFTQGHFDLAAKVDAGSSCVPDEAAKAEAQAAAAGNGGASDVQDLRAHLSSEDAAGDNTLTWALFFFGISILVLGIGTILFALNKQQHEHR